MKGGARAKLRRTHENRVAKECPRRRTGAQALGERVPRGQCQVGPCAPRARPLLVSRVHCGMMCQKKARKQASRQHRADLDETDRASPRRETVVALSQAATTQWSQPSLSVHFAAPCSPPRPESECQRNVSLFFEFLILRERILNLCFPPSRSVGKWLDELSRAASTG